MKKITTILFATILFCSMSCDKKELTPLLIQGNAITAETRIAVPNAKVYLMSNNLPFTGTFNNWQYVDSLFTDSLGSFQFNVLREEDTRYGVYAQKEHYFDYKEIKLPIPENFNLVLFPKAYLKVRVKDEPPFSGLDTMHFSLTAFHPTEWLYGNPIDTTVITVMNPNETQAFIWFFHDNGTWIQDGTFIACPSFDTCYYELFF